MKDIRMTRIQGKYDQAISLHEEALAIRRKALGNGHPDVAQSLNNIAVVKKFQVWAEFRFKCVAV